MEGRSLCLHVIKEVEGAGLKCVIEVEGAGLGLHVIEEAEGVELRFMRVWGGGA